MPRIFTVTFTKEFECSIVAESKEELAAALKEQEHEFDEWAGTDCDWRTSVTDPYRGVQHVRMIPKSFEEPDMGVDDGECVNIFDYQKTHPDYMDKLLTEANEVATRINTRITTPKLFPED